jgi:lipid-binding SYLF domain-containing protein
MGTKWVAGVVIATAFIWAANPSVAQDKGKAAAAELAGESQAALKKLYSSAELAKILGPKAQAILVFPKVKKAGLGIGGQYGEGSLLKNGTAVAYSSADGDA